MDCLPVEAEKEITRHISGYVTETMPAASTVMTACYPAMPDQAIYIHASEAYKPAGRRPEQRPGYAGSRYRSRRHSPARPGQYPPVHRVGRAARRPPNSPNISIASKMTMRLLPVSATKTCPSESTARHAGHRTGYSLRPGRFPHLHEFPSGVNFWMR